jgi:DNA-binding LacI/PurR family transcriptional regulator
VIGVLMSLTYPLAEQQHKELQAAASERGLQIHVVNASEEKGIDAAFKTFAERRIDALLVTAVPYFTRGRQYKPPKIALADFRVEADILDIPAFLPPRSCA